MPRTRTEKLWIGGSGAVATLIIVVGYFFLISPQRAQTSSVQEQVDSARLQGLSLQTRITTLTSQTRRMATYKKELRAAQQALPSGDDLNATPDLLRSLQAIGAATSTSVSSLTVGTPAALTAPVAPAATSPTAAASSTSSAATAATGAAPAAALYTVAITADVSGSTSGLTAFLTRLQTRQPRAVLVTGVTLGAHAASGAAGSGRSSLTLTMTAFVRPGPPATPPSQVAPTSTGTP
jgi:hypothetical protein